MILILKRWKFKKQVSNICRSKKTNDKHISITTSDAATSLGNVKTITSKDATSMTIQGNNISLEEQLQKVEETRLAHQVAAMLYRKNHDLLRTAAQLGKT